MIELGTIAVNDNTSLVVSRNKILVLASELQFDEIGATRMATMASELIRRMIETGEQASVNIALGHENGLFGLFMHFHTKGIQSAMNPKIMHTVFDHVERSEAAHGYDTLTTFKKLPSPAFDVTDELIAIEKDKIERLTQDELYQALNRAFDELKRQSSQLIQTEKMSAVGTMAAGVAHELNNPMMGILNYIQYCLKHTTEDDRRHDVLKDAEKEVKRCAEIVSNLLTFSRMEAEGQEGMTEVSIAEIMDRVLKLTAYRITGGNVVIQTNYANDTPLIWVKANTIQQVFLNIINNALDALKECDQREIKIDIQCVDAFLAIAISDTAGGIAQKHIDKIFEPFFTTKPTGKGTGLGLSISRSIIEQHAGEMRCESKVGLGTTFTIKLPINRRKGENS